MTSLAMEAREAYARHFACEVACPKKSCAAAAGKCCVTSDGTPTIVHKKRVTAWEMKDVVVDPTAPNATKKLKPIDRDCPKCQAPAGGKCRNRWGAPTESYHEARRADARAATAANAAAEPAAVEPIEPAPVASDAQAFVAAATKPGTPLDVACPNTQCRAPVGAHCHSLGKKVATHKVRVYAADPSQSPEVQREPCLRVACPTCNAPRFVRCVTSRNNFTHAHAARSAAWEAAEAVGR